MCAMLEKFGQLQLQLDRIHGFGEMAIKAG